MSLLIETEVEVTFNFDYEALANRVVESALDYEAFPYECEVNLTLTDNDGIWEINREYRNIDNPTDVLSFPMLSYEEAGDGSLTLANHILSEIDSINDFKYIWN